MDGNQVLDYQKELERKLVIGFGTAFGSMIVVGGLVLGLLLLYRNRHRKKETTRNNTEDSRQNSRRQTVAPPQSPRLSGNASSVSSGSDVADHKDVRLSLDNFSFGNVSLSQNEDLAARLENELDRPRRPSRNRYPSGSYSAGILNLNNPTNQMQSEHVTSQRDVTNVPFIHQAGNSRSNFNRDQYNHYPNQNRSEYHYVRSISLDPYLHPHERLDSETARTSHRSYSLDADRQLQDSTPSSRVLSHIVPKTMPSRTRNFDRDLYFGDGVSHETGRFERSDLDSELTGYFDSPVNKRFESRNGSVKTDDNYREYSDFTRGDPELWNQRFDYTEFNRLPRIPLSFSGNRRFLTEHPQRNLFRPI